MALCGADEIRKVTGMDVLEREAAEAVRIRTGDVAQ